VYPEEVEGVLRERPEVADVVVVGAPHDRFGEQVVAVVQPRAGATLDAEALRAACRERLASYKVPRLFVVTEAVERSPAGKADYRWARSLAEEAASSAGA
jgi:acyl-CoA synthetase (AMP-forming)/AMP-acid ligase II